MILRGAATGVVTGGANTFGLSVTDPARPDLSWSRPAYARVTGEILDTPHPPVFLSVTAGEGRLRVTVLSEPPVDGYQIGISETSYTAPLVWWNTSSGSIDQVQTGGPFYLWARATYKGAVSLWSVYGQIRPEDEEWRLTWADEAMDGADGAAYDYATVAYGHTSGFQFLKPSGYTPWIHQYCSYVDAFGLSLLPAVGGPKGTRIDTRLVTGASSAKLTGVAFGFDRTAMQSAPTSTAYYGLALRTAGGDENYAKYLSLYHVLDQTATLIAEADVTSLMTSRPYAGGGTLYWVDVSVQARQNSFQVIAKGQLVLSATDNTIPWMDTKVGTGLWYQGSSNIGYSLTYYMNTGLEDYLRAYARDHTGDPETVTPGATLHNGLDGRSAADCHPASAVTVTPTGAIAATDVQAALAELDSEKSAVGHTHDDRYYTETELSTSGQSSVHWDNITNEPSTYPASAHTHSGGDITSAVASATDADTVDGIHAANLMQLNASQVSTANKIFQNEGWDTPLGIRSTKNSTEGAGCTYLAIRTIVNGLDTLVGGVLGTNSAAAQPGTYRPAGTHLNGMKSGGVDIRSGGATAPVTISTGGADADFAVERVRVAADGAVTIAGNTVWHAGNDGPGSGLDSCSVDGIQGAAIAQKCTAATITVGPSGRDFTTLQAAWDSLKGKTLTGSVNIDVDAGTYDPVTLNANPYGRYVNFRGDMRGGSGVAYAVSGNIAKDGDNCTVTLATWPTGTWGAGDYVTIGDCTTAANVGRFPVVSVDAVNYTVTYTNAAGVAEAAKTGTRLVFCPNRIVSRATDGQDFAVGEHVGQIIGFTCLGTVNSQGIYFNGAYNVNLTRVHAYGMSMGTGGYGGGNAGLNYFSAVKCTYGYYATSGMGAICYYANFHNCTLGVNVSGRSDFTNSAWVVTATGCGTAFMSKGFSPITLQSSHVASDNTTNYIPATANTVSTDGGLIIR